MRIALGIEYDGSAYQGWQSQPGGSAVQDQVEQALAAIAGQPVRVVCAGRTDARVHALAQVVHFDISVERPQSAWVRGTNAHLPRDIAVRWARGMPAEFHARFSARGRRYCYVLLNRPERPGLGAQHMGWCHQPLDVDLMRAAAAQLIGENDFSAFRSAECQAKNPVRHLRDCRIVQDADKISFEFEANAFLHHMVRNLVGSLVYVGMGRRTPDWIGEVLAGRDRRHAAPTFMPEGLYLTGVDYDPAWCLPNFLPEVFANSRKSAYNPPL